MAIIETQPQLREIFKEHPIISYRKRKSLKDILVKAKLWRLLFIRELEESCRLVLLAELTKFSREHQVDEIQIQNYHMMLSLDYFLMPLTV